MFRLASNKPSSSVKVDYDHVHDSREEQHRDQRDVQRVPEREQPLEGLEIGQPARGCEPPVYIRKSCPSKPAALRGNDGGVAGCRAQGAIDIPPQSPA
jgi:hypothetical protein